MADLNNCVLSGRLTEDPKVDKTRGGDSVCRFSLAVNRRTKVDGKWTDDVAFFDCRCWKAQADFLVNYGRKGSNVSVVGQLAVEKWSDKQTGQQRTRYLVEAQQVNLHGGGQGKSSEPRNDPRGSQPDVDEMPF